jgi:UDP-glucose 4-epimerase
VHLAGFIAVGESVADPARYYRNNVGETLVLLDTLKAAGINRVVFSSSAAVYGQPHRIPITEDHPTWPANPYGWSKLMVERMLADFTPAYGMCSVALRYFNAAGADPDGEIGEGHDPETHLIPLVLDAALGRRETITMFGGDYRRRMEPACAITSTSPIWPTPMSSLSDGCKSGIAGAEAFNIGNGSGFSVKELIGHGGKGDRRNILHVWRRDVAETLPSWSARQKGREVLGWFSAIPRWKIDCPRLAWHRKNWPCRPA